MSPEGGIWLAACFLIDEHDDWTEEDVYEYFSKDGYESKTILEKKPREEWLKRFRKIILERHLYGPYPEIIPKEIRDMTAEEQVNLGIRLCLSQYPNWTDEQIYEALPTCVATDSYVEAHCREAIMKKIKEEREKLNAGSN